MLIWERARVEAQNLLEHWPVDSEGLDSLKRIAEFLGAEVRQLPLSPSVSGVIIKESPDDHPVITINMNEAPVRQRFTLAHEIGHLVDRELVAEDDDYSFVDYRKTAADSQDLHEFFANEFAGNLLMPTEKVWSHYIAHGQFATAKHFGVSLPALRIRLNNIDRREIMHDR